MSNNVIKELLVNVMAKSDYSELNSHTHTEYWVQHQSLTVRQLDSTGEDNPDCADWSPDQAASFQQDEKA